MYDTSRETGVTSTVIPALTKAAMYNYYDHPKHNHHLDSTTTKLVDHNNNIDCDYYIQSMYPHDIYQGEILEGIVIRYVQHHQTPFQKLMVGTAEATTRVPSNNVIMEQIHLLSRHSRTVVQQFTTTAKDRPAWKEPSRSDSESTMPHSDSVYTINLRQLYDETKALYSKKGSELFVERVRNILQREVSSSSSLNSTSRTVVHRMTTADPSSTLSMSKQLPIWIEALLLQQLNNNDNGDGNSDTDHPKQTRLDVETYQIAKLIHDVSQISKNITYTIFEEKSPNQDANSDGDIDNNTVVTTQHSSRFICIVHVLHDQTFHKYHRCKNEFDLPLFRGFSFELIGGVDECDDTIIISKGVDDVNAADQHQSIYMKDHEASECIVDDETLMMKMKFLPYMVR